MFKIGDLIRHYVGVTSFVDATVLHVELAKDTGGRFDQYHASSVVSGPGWTFPADRDTVRAVPTFGGIACPSR